MNFFAHDDIIISCATSPYSNAALGIIRISGKFKPEFFSNVFVKKVNTYKSHRVYLNQIIDTSILDEVCVTYFKAPQSFTGEDVLEITCHGNLLNIQRIINLFILKFNLRQALGGEFSYRALKNNKISLSQVEGLDLFLNADSYYLLDQGVSLLNGDLNQKYKELYDALFAHKVALELGIDFLEDVGEDAFNEQFHKTFNNLNVLISHLADRSRSSNNKFLKPQVVLAGVPNAGKSSLFNFLLTDNRAIVSHIPGTTRDYISESIFYETVNFYFLDTAGIRSSTEEIETTGIEKTLELLNTSFFKILVVNPFDNYFDKRLLTHQYDLVIFTHGDLVDFISHKKSWLDLNSPDYLESFDVDTQNAPMGAKEEILSRVNKKYLEQVALQPIPLDRHKSLILKSFDLIETYGKQIQVSRDLGLLSQILLELEQCLSELVGIITPDQTLSSVFSRFCIGK